MAAVARLCFLLLATAAVSRGTQPADLREIKPFLTELTRARARFYPQLRGFIMHLQGSLERRYQVVQTIPDNLGPGLKFSVMLWKYLKENPAAAADHDHADQTPEQGEDQLEGKPEVGLWLSWECNVQVPPPSCNAGGSLYHEVELADHGASSSGGPRRPPKYLTVYGMVIFFSPAKQGAFSEKQLIRSDESRAPKLKPVSEAMPVVRKKCINRPSLYALAECVKDTLLELGFGLPRGVVVGRKQMMETYTPQGHVIRYPIDYQQEPRSPTPDSRVIMLLPAASDASVD